MLIFALSVTGLVLYMQNIVEDDSVDIRKENEEMVGKIVGMCVGTLIGLIFDFHLCQVVAYSMSQLKFLE